jgi:phosphate starvation-inducible protein PhoH and related proteins
VILDEAQNTTIDQMKMFLTRLGYDSKAVITGDVTQVDLPDGRKSGLSDAIRLLGNVEGIGMCRFSDVDVVRHPLVQRIIRAYDSRDESRRRGQQRDDEPQSARGERRPYAGAAGRAIVEDTEEDIEDAAEDADDEDELD